MRSWIVPERKKVAAVSESSCAVSEIPAGLYRGVVDGLESGHCTARIDVRVGPGGCRIVDYEAISDSRGLQHIEHGVLTTDALHLAFGEAAGVTIFHARGRSVFETVDEPSMQVRVSYDGGVLTWAWHWGTDGDAVVERSRATCQRVNFRRAKWR